MKSYNEKYYEHMQHARAEQEPASMYLQCDALERSPEKLWLGVEDG